MCHILEGSECCAWFKLYKGNKQIDLIVKLVVVSGALVFQFIFFLSRTMLTDKIDIVNILDSTSVYSFPYSNI